MPPPPRQRKGGREARLPLRGRNLVIFAPMALRWDPLLVRHLAKELDDRLAGSRLRALRFDGASRDLLLLFRNASLVWRLHPTRGHLRVDAAVEPAGGDIRLPYRLRAVSAPPDERLLRFEFLPQRSGRGPVDLVVELLGNQWNAAIVEVPSGVLRHVLVRRDGPRPFLVGHPYPALPATARAGVDGSLDARAWESLVLAEPPGAGRRRALVGGVAWTSSINAGPLLALEGDALDVWRDLADPEAPRNPCVLDFDRGPQPYPDPLPGVPHRPAPSLLEAFVLAAEGEGEPLGEGDALLPGDLVSALEGALDGAQRRLTALEAEMQALDDPLRVRGMGDLLLARFHEVPRGRERVTLTGFAGEPVEVTLDPSKTPQENAEHFYGEAARIERAQRRLPALVAEARAKVDDLEALMARVRAGELSAGELRSILPDRPSPSGGAREGPTLPYTTYRSSGGLEIRVGRGARRNDDLTFRHSAPQDVWLHAQQAAGAHVILRWGRSENPPARDLSEAAVLAALNSRARTSGSVPVAWTFRKYVRKPRKAPPGSVVPDRVQTLFVRPDPELARRLAADPERANERGEG